MGVYDRDWWKEKNAQKPTPKQQAADTKYAAPKAAPNQKAASSKPKQPSTWTTPSSHGQQSAPRKRDSIHPLMVLIMFLSVGTFMFGLFTLIGDKKSTEKVRIIERIITPIKPAEKMPPRQAPAPQRPST